MWWKNVTIMTVTCVLISFSSVGFAADTKGEGFPDMISELEKQIDLSKDKWDQLKPELDQKSQEMQQSMHESIEKGFAEFGKMSDKFDQMSKEAEAKAKEMLSSEEVKKLQEFLQEFDEEAIRETKEKMVAELTAILEVTEEQAEKIKPVLEDSFDKLSSTLESLAAEGAKGLATFQKEFEKLSENLRSQLDELLDEQQIDRFDQFNEERKETIQNTLFQ